MFDFWESTQPVIETLPDAFRRFDPSSNPASSFNGAVSDLIYPVLLSCDYNGSWLLPLHDS